MPEEQEWKLKVEETLIEHNRRITDLDAASKQHSEALHENTVLTRKIADNTSEMVELFKGAKAVRRFVFWASPLVAVFYTLYHWFIKEWR